MNFSDFLNNKQPLGWSPDREHSILDVEKDYRVNTPGGVKHLFIVYCVVEFRPRYRTAVREDDPSLQDEPPEILKVYPVVQFEEGYIKSVVLTGPPGHLGDRAKLEWAMREFQSGHNHFHLLSKEIQDNIESICEKTAEERLDDERSDWEG